MSLIVILQNDGTGDDDTGHYDYEVRINSRVLVRGRIEDHRRADGWAPLVEKVASRNFEVKR